VLTIVGWARIAITSAGPVIAESSGSVPVVPIDSIGDMHCLTFENVVPTVVTVSSTAPNIGAGASTGAATGGYLRGCPDGANVIVSNDGGGYYLIAYGQPTAGTDPESAPAP